MNPLAASSAEMGWNNNRNWLQERAKEQSRDRE